MIDCRGKVKWFKAGMYSMIFKVEALRQEIGDPLDMYSVDFGISPNWTIFRKGRKWIRLLLCVG